MNHWGQRNLNMTSVYPDISRKSFRRFVDGKTNIHWNSKCYTKCVKNNLNERYKMTGKSKWKKVPRIMLNKCFLINNIFKKLMILKEEITFMYWPKNIQI